MPQEKQRALSQSGAVFLVTLVGRDILRGLSLSHRIEPDDFSHLICACLLHDIGYVSGGDAHPGDQPPDARTWLPTDYIVQQMAEFQK